MLTHFLKFNHVLIPCRAATAGLEFCVTAPRSSMGGG